MKNRWNKLSNVSPDPILKRSAPTPLKQRGGKRGGENNRKNYFKTNMLFDYS